jgi:hypothetical protein
MFEAIQALLEKEGGISLVRSIFEDIEVLVSNFEADLVADKNVKNAIIDAIVTILQKQKS